jgi:acetyl esterase/lipase
MSAVLAHFARDEGIDIKLHLMIVPATDMRYCNTKLQKLTADNCPYDSVLQLKDVPWGPLGREQWFLKYWVSQDAGKYKCVDISSTIGLTQISDELERILNNEWILTPVIAPNFKNLPRAHIVTAEFDLERDEGEYYAKLLRDSGNPVTTKQYDGCPHAFAHYNHPERGIAKSMEFIEDTAELLTSVHRD